MIDSYATSLLGPAASPSKVPGSGADNAQIDQAARAFEATMLTAMLKPIFESVETSAPFGGGEGEKMWRGLLVEQYANEIASTGGIGIADEVRAELIRAQEAASTSP